MKKKIQYIVAALSIAAMGTACSDFLDKEPQSDVTAGILGIDPNKGDTVNYTAEQMEQLLGGTYRNYKDQLWALDLYLINDGQSDDAYAGEPLEESLQNDEFRMSPVSNRTERYWGDMYKQIASANTVIQRTSLVTDPNLTEARRKEIVAEASFIRAYNYFNLVQAYGDVPLVTKEIPAINNENIDEVYPLLYPPRAPIDSVYEQIIRDLEYASQYAPNPSVDKFKVTKDVANLVLAQVYVTKDGVDDADWSKVKQYVAPIVNNSNYRLLPNYDDLFAAPNEPTDGVLPKVNLINENSSESMFEINYFSSDNGSNWGATMFYGFDWKKFNTPSVDLYNAFTNAGDTIRRNAAIRFEDVTGKWADNFWTSKRYPFCFKQRAQERGNVILFRLPEAILLLAEAEAELGNIAESKRLLNIVRSRVQLPNTTANSPSDLLLAIENEHRFEFAFEGKRWMYLKRRGRFIDVMRACTDQQREYANMNLNENKLFWPIPQTERDQNSFLTQNPGY